MRRSTRDLHTHALIESLECDVPKMTLHRRCLPGCGHCTPATRDIETCFLYRLAPLTHMCLLSFQNFGLLFRVTLLSIQNFIDQEEECEERKAELDAKQSEERKTALRQLVPDFEDQMERGIMELDDHTSVSSTEVEESKPEQDPLPVTQHATVDGSAGAEEEEAGTQEGTHINQEASLSSIYAMTGLCQLR